MAVADEDPSLEVTRHAARETLKHCDVRLAKYRGALDSGIDSSVVGPWIAEVQAERQRAEASLARATSTQRLTRSQIKELIAQLGGLITTLEPADPGDRAPVYSELGLRLVYQPSRRVIQAVASPMGPGAKDCVRGAAAPPAAERTAPSSGGGDR